MSAPTQPSMRIHSSHRALARLPLSRAYLESALHLGNRAHHGRQVSEKTYGFWIAHRPEVLKLALDHFFSDREFTLG